MIGLRIKVPTHAGVKRRRTTPDGSIEVGKLVGCGSQGQVHSATVLATGTRIAVKILPRHSAQASHEAAVLSRLPRHANVVALPAGCSIQRSKANVWIPLELADTDMLEALLASRRFSEATARRYFSHVVAAVAHCHRYGVYHLDVKPENVLIRDGRALLADFGSSFHTSTVPAMAAFPSGSVSNAAPEVVAHTGEPGDRSLPYAAAAADVWSLGVLLFVMVTGRPPWASPVKSDRRYAALHSGSFAWPADMAPELVALLSAMLLPDPAQRMSLSEVAAHPWVRPGAASPPCHAHRRTSSTPDMMRTTLPAQLTNLRLSLSINDFDQAELVHAGEGVPVLAAAAVTATTSVGSHKAAPMPQSTLRNGSVASAVSAVVGTPTASLASSSVCTVLSHRSGSTGSVRAFPCAGAGAPRPDTNAPVRRRVFVRAARGGAAKRSVVRKPTSVGAGDDASVDGPTSPCGKRSGAFFRAVNRELDGSAAPRAAAVRGGKTPTCVAGADSNACVVTAADLADGVCTVMSPRHKRTRRARLQSFAVPAM